MSMIHWNFYRRLVPLVLLLCIAMLFAGCFTTKFTLGKLEDAKVDLGYVGNWQSTDDSGKKLTLIVRNIDNHRYYVEWTDDKDAGKGAQRFTGHVSPVAGVGFAQLKPLTADGTIEENNMILRVGMKDGSLTIQDLKDEFFKDKTISSDDDLRKLIEANVENKAMYDGDMMKFTRLPEEEHGVK